MEAVTTFRMSMIDDAIASASRKPEEPLKLFADHNFIFEDGNKMPVILLREFEKFYSIRLPGTLDEGVVPKGGFIKGIEKTGTTT